LFPKNSHTKLLLLSIFPLICFFIIFGFSNTFIFFISYIIFMPISLYLGYKTRALNVYITRFIFLLGASVIGFFVYPNLYSFMDNTNSRISRKVNPIVLLDRNKDTIKINKEKVTVLEFWFKECRPCLKNFPDFEKFYLKNKENAALEIYTVNVAIMEGDFEDRVAFTDSLGYAFTTLYAPNKNAVKEFGIDTYPTAVIIRNDSIVYQGSLNLKSNMFINRLDDEVYKNIK